VWPRRPRHGACLAKGSRRLPRRRRRRAATLNAEGTSTGGVHHPGAVTLDRTADSPHCHHVGARRPRQVRRECRARSSGRLLGFRREPRPTRTWGPAAPAEFSTSIRSRAEFALPSGSPGRTERMIGFLLPFAPLRSGGWCSRPFPSMWPAPASRAKLETDRRELRPGVTEVYAHPATTLPSCGRCHRTGGDRVDDHRLLVEDPACARHSGRGGTTHRLRQLRAPMRSL